jgi:hypothetical protein
MYFALLLGTMLTSVRFVATRLKLRTDGGPK